MTIPKVEAFQTVTETKDVLGKVTGEATLTYYGVIERETQFESSKGQLDVVGKGLIFTDELEDITEGSKIQVDAEKFYVKRVFVGKVMGVFHHLEITYG